MYGLELTNKLIIQKLKKTNDMKKETLQSRIEKHLYTKGGKLAKKYEDVIELLNNPERSMRPI